MLRISHSAVIDSWRDRERALRDLGVDVRLLSAHTWNEGGADVPLRPRPGEPVRGLRTWGRHPALFLYDPWALWRTLGERWDLVDIHEEPYALATAEILLLCRLRRQRPPFTLYSAQNIDKTYPVPFRWLERWALRGAAGLSVCNSEAGRILRRKGASASPTTIPLGLDPSMFSPRPSSSVADDGGPPVVGYVGRLERHKGVHVLIEAVSRTPDLQLRVAGSGPEEGELRAVAARWLVQDRVRFLGGVPHEDLPELYADLDLLAVPSVPTDGWLEQFGRVAIEAMASGVPVIASDTGALAEVVGGAGVLVPPGDPQALADNLVRVAADGRLREEMVDAGRDRVPGFTWAAVASQYDELYRTALHAPRTPLRERVVEVVVVAYGSADLVEQALTPLVGLPVTVVDNSSSAEVAQRCARLGVRYLDPGFNGGFAAGVNVALRSRLHPEADVLLLNPDAVVSAAGVSALQQALHEDRDTATVGPSQWNAEGRRDRVAWSFPGPSRAWLHAVGLSRHGPQSEFVIGSVLLIRAEALRQVGELDERFFLYAEETDWAYRASLLGWRHREVPSVRATHVGAASSSDPTRRTVHFHASQERFYRKHWGAAGWQAARAAQLLGSTLRLAVHSGGRRSEAWQRIRLYRHGPVRTEDARWTREQTPAETAT